MAAALCRSLARRGGVVAPFKAQNMSNHAAVVPRSDGAGWGEIGRAQATQAGAARFAATTACNPILLKPSSATGSHVVVDGVEVGTTGAADWGTRTRDLRHLVLDRLGSLRRDAHVVVAEGAGGAAEINLLDRDLVNLPLAAAAGIPVVLVVDIEPGGAFAAAHGTIDLLPEHLRRTVVGIVFNRFRGDPSLLDPGLAELARRCGVPVLAVLPHLGPDGLLGVEDSLDVASMAGPARRHDTGRSRTEPVRVAAVRLPHLANPSDLDPLRVEPDAELGWATRPGHLRDADLVVVPGSRATVADLAWLREVGLADALVEVAARGTDVLGICAGQQILGRWIDDPVESGAGRVPGLGLLPVTTTFGPDKVVDRVAGRCAPDGAPVEGYRIHLGRVRTDPGAEPLVLLDDGSPEGSRVGSVRGTSLHGVLDADDARRALLADVARRRGRTFAPGSVAYTDALDAQHERLADWLDEHLAPDVVDGVLARAGTPGTEPGW